jgi:hypothetical protein
MTAADKAGESSHLLDFAPVLAAGLALGIVLRSAIIAGGCALAERAVASGGRCLVNGAEANGDERS